MCVCVCVRLCLHVCIRQKEYLSDRVSERVGGSLSCLAVESEDVEKPDGQITLDSHWGVNSYTQIQTRTSSARGRHNTRSSAVRLSGHGEGR